jgi:hypothetical protein
MTTTQPHQCCVRNISKYVSGTQFLVDLKFAEIPGCAAISADIAVKLDAKGAQAWYGQSWSDHSATRSGCLVATAGCAGKDGPSHWAGSGMLGVTVGAVP